MLQIVVQQRIKRKPVVWKDEELSIDSRKNVGFGKKSLPNLVDLLLAAQVERTSFVDWRRIETEE